MLTPGARLGQALMEPPMVKGELTLSGFVEGDSALSLGSEAAKEAHAFFGHYEFELTITAERSDEGYLGTFWARHL